ncbi:hypothetical protein D3C80_1444820 [compost metagenome]
MADHQFFDFSRVDVKSAANNHIFRPVDDKIEAIGITACQVTGSEPALFQHLSRGFRAVKVAFHHVVATHCNLANLIYLRQCFAGDINQTNFNPPNRLANRTHFIDPPRMVKGRHRAGFR